MTRLHNYLNELALKKEIKVRKIKSTDDNFQTAWTIKSLPYRFTAIKMFKLNYWDCAFFEKTGKYQMVNFSISDVLSIFTGAKKSLEMLIKQKDPDGFAFSALTPKLEPLYVRFSKKIANKTIYKSLPHKPGTDFRFEKPGLKDPFYR